MRSYGLLDELLNTSHCRESSGLRQCAPSVRASAMDFDASIGQGVFTSRTPSIKAEYSGDPAIGITLVSIESNVMPV